MIAINFDGSTESRLMLFLSQSATVYGIDALIVDIEVNLQPVKIEANQAPPFTIVGLPDAAIRESRERVRAAITNSKYFFPFHKTTINLAPADVRKEGAAFDLPMALGILGAAGDLGVEDADGMLSVGELSLDGRVRPVRGALSITLKAREVGVKNILLPEENASEAAVVAGINVYPVKEPRSAAELVYDLKTSGATRVPPLKLDISELKSRENKYRVDFNEVRRPADGEAGFGGGECGRAQHTVYRAAGFGEDDAREAFADDFAAAGI